MRKRWKHNLLPLYACFSTHASELCSFIVWWMRYVLCTVATCNTTKFIRCHLLNSPFPTFTSILFHMFTPPMLGPPMLGPPRQMDKKGNLILAFFVVTKKNETNHINIKTFDWMRHMNAKRHTNKKPLNHSTMRKWNNLQQLTEKGNFANNLSISGPKFVFHYSGTNDHLSRTQDASHVWFRGIVSGALPNSNNLMCKRCLSVEKLLAQEFCCAFALHKTICGHVSYVSTYLAVECFATDNLNAVVAHQVGGTERIFTAEITHHACKWGNVKSLCIWIWINKAHNKRKIKLQGA